MHVAHEKGACQLLTWTRVPLSVRRVELTVRSKSLKSEDTGVVRWAVEIFNQKDELVATYDLLTENVP